MRLRTFPLMFALAMLACASPTPPPLIAARASVAELEADVDANRHASVQVLEAKQALERADRSWASEEDVAEAEHLAYLAERRVEIARSSATGVAALERAEALTRERDTVRLEARTGEAEAARAAAERRAREAEAARAQAEDARGEAEAARLRAETARAEAEQARLDADAARTDAERARHEAEAAAARERALREELASLQARETERGLLMTLGDVLFDLDRATLKEGAKTRLDRLAEFLGRYPERSLLVEGHTDSTGTDAYNLGLSERRADAVAGHLIEQGVALGRIIARGYGKTYPVAGNETSAGRQQNRRVELVILDPGVDPASRARPVPSP